MSSIKRRAAGFLGIAALSLASLLLASCDDKPNPQFEQAMRDQQAAQAGDPYAGLSNVPRNSRLQRTPADQRRGYASQSASALREAYEPLLAQLDAEAKTPALAPLRAECRKSFDDALAFQAAESMAREAVAGTASALNARLTKCRDGVTAAIETGDGAGGAEAQAEAAILKRFASVGMVLVGASAIAHGDEAAGTELWVRGEALAAEDKPGFKVTPRMFGNN